MRQSWLTEMHLVVNDTGHGVFAFSVNFSIGVSVDSAADLLDFTVFDKDVSRFYFASVDDLGVFYKNGFHVLILGCKYRKGERFFYKFTTRKIHFKTC